MSRGGKIEIVGSEAEPITWEGFKAAVQEDIKAYKDAVRSDTGYHSEWIYRGQSNSKWLLETSLERYLRDELGEDSKKYLMSDYYQKLSAIIPAVNSLTAHKFERFSPDIQEYSHARPIPPPQYALMCFVRHHGFPSPLLDWSRSYYVAAFFAFSGAKQGENVSVYAYKQWNGPPDSWAAATARIEELGSYVQTHPRHYAQQSNYTVCRSKDEESGNVFFRNHEDALGCGIREQKMKKFILSAREREKALEELYAMNINDHTLFGDEGALLKTQAYKEFVLLRK